MGFYIRMYVYKTTNLENGLIYIGISKKCSEKSLGYFGSGLKLKEAIKTFGKQNFKKEILDEDDSFRYCDLQLLERFYITHFNSKDPLIGYNISDGGDGNVGKSNGMFNRKHTEESKQKIRETRLYKKSLNPDFGKLSEEVTEKRSKFMTERNKTSPTLPNGHSEESKRKISETIVGMFERGEVHRNYATFTDERKQEYSERFSGENNPFYGKTHTDETKERIKNSIRANFPAVDKLTLEGAFVKYYESIVDVYEDGHRPDLVKSVLKGKSKTHGGFLWRLREKEIAD